MFVGPDTRVPVKLENDAGVEALLHVMVRETTQDEMLGALVKKFDIEDVYVRSESAMQVLAGKEVRRDQVSFKVSLGVL